MSRAFLYGTILQGFEQMMMSVPDFTSKWKGLIIMGKKIDEKEEYNGAAPWSIQKYAIVARLLQYQAQL